MMDAMAAPAFKPVDISILPPSFDLLQAMRAVETLKDFERTIDKGEVTLATWRAATTAKLRDGLAAIEVAAKPLPKELVAEHFVPILDAVFPSIDALLAAYETPFDKRPELQLTMARLRKLSTPAGRFIRKQVERAEELRQAQYNAVVDMRYALLGFRAEFMPDSEPVGTFTTGKDLGDFLRKRTA